MRASPPDDMLDIAALAGLKVALWGWGREGRAAWRVLRRRLPALPLTLFCSEAELAVLAHRGLRQHALIRCDGARRLGHGQALCQTQGKSAMGHIARSQSVQHRHGAGEHADGVGRGRDRLHRNALGSHQGRIADDDEGGAVPVLQRPPGAADGLGPHARRLAHGQGQRRAGRHSLYSIRASARRSRM